MTDWSPEEAAEIERIDAGHPSPPSPDLRYVATDCFVCGKVTIRRDGSPRIGSCPECGRPVVPVVLRQAGPLGNQLITEERAAGNRESGGYTYNLFPPWDYDGPGFVLAVIRIGDHAHVTWESATFKPHPASTERQQMIRGKAGGLRLRWDDWLRLRGMLEQHEGLRIAEVEKPNEKQIELHVVEG